MHATRGGAAHGGTHVTHQMVARGNKIALERLLALLDRRLGSKVLREMLNTQVGKSKLGCLDMALHSMIKLTPVLRRYGATEQQAAPKDWKAGRRAHSAEYAGNVHRGLKSREHLESYWNKHPQPNTHNTASGSASSWGSGSANDPSNWSNWSGGYQTWGR